MDRAVSRQLWTGDLSNVSGPKLGIMHLHTFLVLNYLHFLGAEVGAAYNNFWVQNWVCKLHFWVRAPPWVAQLNIKSCLYESA